jgi:ATP-dependent DNA helicase DinG
LSWDVVNRSPGFKTALQDLLALLDDMVTLVEVKIPSIEKDLKAAMLAIKNFKQILQALAQPSKEKILWLERFKQTLVFHATPCEIAQYFNQVLQSATTAYVFTSATLTMATEFNTFTQPLGLEKAQTLLLQSPFHFQQQALLYLPRSLPDPKQENYYEFLLKRVIPVIQACGGRSFFLFTSHKALKQVAQLLDNVLEYPLLVQGDESKSILLERFRHLGNAVLLGTATFWEGVDVKGRALSCVIIDKLPFASPRDPVVSGKLKYLQSQGLSGFDVLSLPQAVMALKQGVGRLIRDVSDRGILMIADPRLTGREYGRTILASLPALPKTRDEKVALNFIKDMICNENSCD